MLSGFSTILTLLFIIFLTLPITQEEEMYIQSLFVDNPYLEVRNAPGMGRGVFAKIGIFIFLKFYDTNLSKHLYKYLFDWTIQRNKKIT
jgi:hypothetical protein